ncbi:MAG: PIN domain-containing protein [Parcubacteria group bacterium]
MAKSVTLKTPVIHVVLDTNVLFTELADKLISREIGEFIAGDVQQLGLDLNWYLPEIVIAERRLQMTERAKGLLVPLAKLETLLGHKLGMNEDILSSRVEEAIQRQIKEYALKELVLDHSAVDWPIIIAASVTRSPPFSKGDTEKGFKDAVVLESFMQLAGGLPRSPASCRVILLTADGLLADAAHARISQFNNVSVAADLSALRTVLNAVAAHLSQDTVDDLIGKVSALFFDDDDPDNATVLYYKWGIYEKLSDFSQLSMVPSKGFSVRRKQTLIGDTSFLRKVGQKVSLSTEVIAEVEAVKKVARAVVTRTSPPPNALAPRPTLSWSDLMSDRNALSATERLNLLSAEAAAAAKRAMYEPTISAGLLGTATSDDSLVWDEVTVTGEHVFKVLWDVTLMQNGKIAKPQFTSVEYKNTHWDQ